MVLYPNGGYIVAGLDGTFAWYQTMGDTIFEYIVFEVLANLNQVDEADLGDADGSSSGGEALLLESLPLKDAEVSPVEIEDADFDSLNQSDEVGFANEEDLKAGDQAMLETLIVSEEVPPEHYRELERFEFEDLELMHGLRGKSRRLFLTLPHRRFATSEHCVPVNHMIAHGSPINSILEKYWNLFMDYDFTIKYHPTYEKVLSSYIGDEKHTFVSSSYAAAINPAAGNISLIGQDLIMPPKLRLVVAE